MKKTMTEIYEVKMKSLKTILKELEKGPYNSSELKHLVESELTESMKRKTIFSRMSFNRYLNELKDLDLIYEEEGLYYLASAKKRVFKSTTDLKLAVDHSKKLLYSSKTEQLFDLMEPYMALEQLAFNPERYQNLMMHFKTGYFKEMWAPLQRYAELTNKYDRPFVTHLQAQSARALQMSELLNPNGKRVPGKLPETFYDNSDDDESIPEDVHLLPPPGYEDSLTEEASKIKKKDLKELFALQKSLLGEFVIIARKMNQNIPLDGYCDCCPDRNFSISQQK